MQILHHPWERSLLITYYVCSVFNIIFVKQANAFCNLPRQQFSIYHISKQSEVLLTEHCREKDGFSTRHDHLSRVSSSSSLSPSSSRRKFLFHQVTKSLLLVPSSLSVLMSGSDNMVVAHAAAPITTKETDSIGAMTKRAFRQKPPKVLRRKLSMDFAVLLMRSSYNALDQLDCVAMDQFQRDFFLIRRSEYEPYIGALGPGVVQQGDLTDPNYFDFISYAQYRTINREITQDPPFVFTEQQPIEQEDGQPEKFVPVIIRRDPALTNDRLGPQHCHLVGSAILDRFEETFTDDTVGLPKIARYSRPNPDILLGALKKLLNLFLINGYAYSGDVSIAVPTTTTPKKTVAIGQQGGTTFQILLSAPATLWGGKVLQAEGEQLSNDFFLKAATEYLSRAGYIVSSSNVYDGSNQKLSITVY